MWAACPMTCSLSFASPSSCCTRTRCVWSAASSACPRTWSSPALPRPWPGRSLPRCYYPRPSRGAARGRCDRSRRNRQGWPHHLAVLRRRARLPRHRRARGQARLRLAVHHPLHQHRRRHDRRGARARLGAAQAHHCPHYRRGSRHLPRLLRPHAQTRRHGGVGIIAYIIVRFILSGFCSIWMRW